MPDASPHSELVARAVELARWIELDSDMIAPQDAQRIRDLIEQLEALREVASRKAFEFGKRNAELQEQLETTQHQVDENRQIIESERDYIRQLKEQLEAVDGTYRMVVFDDEHPDGFEYERFPVGHDQTLWFTKEPSNVTRIELRFDKAKED